MIDPRTYEVFWEQVRPILSIEHAGGGKLGNCYYGSSYKITSSVALDQEEINSLRANGFLGGGQEFYIRGQLMEGGKLESVPKRWPHKDDWHQWEVRQKHPPSGVDNVPPTVRDARTKERLEIVPVNRYSGEPITSTHPFPYFEYLVESRVDSSD